MEYKNKRKRDLEYLKSKRKKKSKSNPKSFFCPKLDHSCDNVCRMCSLFVANLGMSTIVRNDEATM